jgi:hypothetical protein
MLTIHPDLVCFVIAKAQEFQAQEEVVIPETASSPSDDWALQILADHGDDLTFQEVKIALRDLDFDHQVELVALMWLGRGDYAIDEWETAVEDARDAASDHLAAYLLGHPMVSDYLREGLLQHGYVCDA